MAKRMPKEVAAYLHKIGQEYGKLGGKKAAANMTPAERKARAKKASKAAAKKRMVGARATAGAAEDQRMIRANDVNFGELFSSVATLPPRPIRLRNTDVRIFHAVRAVMLNERCSAKRLRCSL